MRLNNARVSCVAALLAVAGLAATSLGQVVTVSPTKANGDFISGGGNFANNFKSGSGAGASVFLKARARDTGQALDITGSTFTVLAGPSVMTPASSWWVTDFQFTPRSDDVGVADSILGRNYNLTYQLDTNPSATGQTFVTVSNPLFGPGAADAWDDGDGFFVNPGGGPLAWNENTTDYVVSQSWRINFGFLAGAILPPGDYDVNWFAQDDSGYRIAETSLTARVIPASGPSLTLDAQDSCLQTGNQLVVEVNLNNASSSIVGGQFFLQYDTSRLSLVSAVPGDAPFETEIFSLHNAGLGQLTYGVGVSISGGPGTSAPTSMARITFNVIGGDFCPLSDLVEFRTGVLPTRITTSTGTDILPNLVDLGSVTRDTSAPTISVSNIAVNADAGLCTALVGLGATVSDTCDTAPTLVGTRSDSLPLNAPYPTGTTTISWAAADSCGNTSSATQTVTVNALNTLNVTVDLQAMVEAGPFTRCITFELDPVGAGPLVISSHTMTFSSGTTGPVSVNIPCGNYECITARDTLHTLRSTGTLVDAGVAYTSTFVAANGDALKGGNLNGDAFIDILDFGIFVGQLSSNPSPGANTTCSTVGPHADVTGDGDVDTGDFTFIANNFLNFSETRCDGSLRPGGPAGPLTPDLAAQSAPKALRSIKVADLKSMGLRELRHADLNSDGVIDQFDIASFMSGALPVTLADVNRDGAVDGADVEDVTAQLDSLDRSTADIDGDGAVTLTDLVFVLDHMGADVSR